MLATATAGIVLPPRFTSTSIGAAAISASQMSWWVSLEVPQVVAGLGVGRDEAGPEQVVAGAVAAGPSTDGAPNGM